MKKSRISKTAQVNLMMLADLGIDEAVRFKDVLGFNDDPLSVFSHIPMASKIPLCISIISEVLYQRTNEIIFQRNNPIILDLACGYSPRVLKVCDGKHSYIGVDLSDVIENLTVHREELTKEISQSFNDYYSIDLTHREELVALIDKLQVPASVITQGLLTYLKIDQKQILMDNIKSLLIKNGGCWIIPDAAPDRLLPEVFSAVLGSAANLIFSQVMKILDAAVKRDRSQIGWQSTDEICEALITNGFHVERIPLYTDTLELRSLSRIGPQKAQKVMEKLSAIDSLIVTVD